MIDDKNDLEPSLFIEKQRFNQWWLWLLLLAINGFSLYRIFQGYNEAGKANNAGSWVGLGTTVLVAVLVYSVQLETKISKHGIYVRLFPFHIKLKHYPWSALSKIYVRRYNAIPEFGGWGIRFGSNGTAFNVSGNMGLQLEFLNRKRLLIGTNKAAELTKVIEELNEFQNQQPAP
jgi:hypothetical protein